MLMLWIGELAGNPSLQFIHIIRFGTLLSSLLLMKKRVSGTCNVFDHYNTTGFFLFLVILESGDQLSRLSQYQNML